MLKHCCNKKKICLLQESWLNPRNLEKLSKISSDFFAYGVFGMDDNALVYGRPYGGVGILFHKTLTGKINPLKDDINHRFLEGWPTDCSWAYALYTHSLWTSYSLTWYRKLCCLWWLPLVLMFFWGFSIRTGSCGAFRKCTPHSSI